MREELSCGDKLILLITKCSVSTGQRVSGEGGIAVTGVGTG